MCPRVTAAAETHALQQNGEAQHLGHVPKVPGPQSLSFTSLFTDKIEENSEKDPGHHPALLGLTGGELESQYLSLCTGVPSLLPCPASPPLPVQVKQGFDFLS